MAYIDSFSIEGLTTHVEPYSKKLNKDINIFFGANGSGKTSLLKILHSALTGNENFVDAVPFARASIQLSSRQFKEPITKSIDIGKSKSDKQVEGTDATTPAHVLRRLTEGKTKRNKWKTEPDVNIRGWNHRYLPTSRLFSSLGPLRSGFFDTNAQPSDDPSDRDPA